MFITITNAGKGKPYKLPVTLDKTELKIGIKSVRGRVGWYNISEELEWRYAAQGGGPSEAIIIEPGLYNFDSLVETLTGEIDGFEISVNKNTGKITMTVPADHQIWLPDRIRKMFGLDDDGWLTTGEYESDHAVEFSPQRIEIYLRQLNTSKNIHKMDISQLLGFVTLSNGGFGEYFSEVYEKPSMKELQPTIQELDLDFKVVWRDQSEKLDNHDQPLDLELWIK